jgi:hypothetical protein
MAVTPKGVEWQRHPVYVTYEASSDGQVRGPRKTLRLFPRKGGYLGSNISFNGVRINFEAHVLVCEAFHGLRPLPHLEVRHLNGMRLDNRPENLCWGTKAENARDILRHGRNHEANKTHCPSGHEYTPENTYRAPGSPNKRNCRRCMVIREAQRPPRTKRKAAA